MSPHEILASFDPLAMAAAFMELRTSLPADRLVEDAAVLTSWAHDGKTQGQAATLGIQPCTTDEVALTLRVCQQHRTPVWTRGAGTNQTGSFQPLGPGVALDLRRMDRILSLEPANLMAEVEAGCLTKTLRQAAEQENLLYAPDPASWERSTIGGNVATGAGGPSTLRYGVTRDWLLGLEAVLPGGEIIRTGAGVWKFAAGLDLTRLLCGSAGTLAVITRVRVKLLPLPRAQTSIIAIYPDASSAVAAVSRGLASGVLPTAIEFLDELSLRLWWTELGQAADRTGCALLARCDGAIPSIADTQAAILAAELSAGAIFCQTSNDGQRQATWWAARDRLSPAMRRVAPAKVNEDVSVPRTELPALLDFVAAHCGQELTPCVFGHIGDGNLHVNFLFDPADVTAAANARSVRDDVLGWVIDHRGAITGEHGVGTAKADWLERQVGRANLDLQRRIKRAFDPLGILNPGKEPLWTPSDPRKRT